ncbi:IclR family transcriptional regulator [Salinibacterium hongtaonis]|uniref:IclR family transcriptional regulator n=1 Tax=Homoserinimonas hongtaonis TaxID=2079791 RepID=UPI000D3939BD|nr:IclR family transcriptional regulator [Salinibacterium hongtaonis]AWB89003.1 hypothetical protein C2138_05115 [Salinibacterium hongtaonis]
MASIDGHTNTDPLARPATVLHRFIAILDAVKGTEGARSIAELVAITGMPKSTVFRLVSELVEQRYLARADGGVTLGLRLFELGARAVLPRRILSVAAPTVRGLSERTGERVGLWVQQGLDMVSIAAVQGRLPMLSAHAGMRSPALTTASGKAFLAFCADQSVVDRVSASLVDEDAERFRDELVDVRTSVLATDLGLSYRGVVAVASPIIAPDRTVLGAISVAGPRDSMRVDNIAPLVRAASLSLSRQLAATA